MGLKWDMKDSKWFLAKDNGYTIQVFVDGFAPTWYITKGKEVIDSCFNYPVTKCELSAKVQAEIVYNKIIHNINEKTNQSNSE